MTLRSRGRPVVVGVDGSAPAQYAARWAAGEARLRQVPLRLVHASRTPPPRGPGRSADSAATEPAVDSAAELLSATRMSLARQFPDLALETELTGSDARTALIAESRQAPLVVVGARGSGGFAGLCLGSVSSALAAHAASPVVVVRGTSVHGPAPAAGPVVVGVDGTEYSDIVLQFAFEAAAARDADLIAVHAWSDFLLDSTGLVRPFAQYQELVEDAEDLLRERMTAWKQKFPDVRTRRHVVHDRAHKALLARSEFAQLLVVGSRGRGSLAGMFLGSTSTTLVHHAGCPVAVIPTGRP